MELSRVLAVALTFATGTFLVGSGCGDLELGFPGFSPDQPGDVTISINPGAEQRGELAFGQNPMVLEADTRVTWINNDTVNHTITARSGAFDSGTLTPTQSFSFTFGSRGAYDYYCRFHPSETGLIVIEVTEPLPSGTPQTSPSPITGATPIIVPASPVPLPVPTVR